ncbi:MAG: 50S ribosomal protein L4 [Magnetococcales bacterium]|nr:50S ribosomal protein L4 [Magnetococcales bacterium]
MIEFPLKDTHNQHIRTIQLSDVVFGRPRRDDLLSLTVHYQLSKRRAGTASTKRRSEVAGGGKKPYRQKGTGNARQGTIRAPQYRTGGIVFGPHPRDYAFSLPKKVRKLSLQTALSLKRELNEITIIDGFHLTEIKTKLFSTMLGQLGVKNSALIVLAEQDDKVQLSARNLPGISVIRAEGVNVYDLLSHHTVILTEPALQRLEERLA